MKQEIKDFIKANYYDMTFTQMAKELGISREAVSYYTKIIRTTENLSPKSAQRFFTEEEDKILLTEGLTVEEISKLIGRSHQSIISRRHFLKTHKNIEYTPIGEINRKFIKEHINEMSSKEMAEKLGLTLGGVQAHIRKLQKSGEVPRYNATPEEVKNYMQQIIEIYPQTTTNADIANALGISQPMVSAYIRKIKDSGIKLKRKSINDLRLEYIKDHYQEMSYKEMAEELGISEKSIPTYLNRYRKQGLLPYKTKKEISDTLIKTGRSRSKYDKYKDYIIENYRIKTYAQMARELGVNERNLSLYMHKLRRNGELLYKNNINFNKSKEVKPMDNFGYIKKIITKMSYEKFAKYLYTLYIYLSDACEMESPPNDGVLPFLKHWLTLEADKTMVEASKHNTK